MMRNGKYLLRTQFDYVAFLLLLWYNGHVMGAFGPFGLVALEQEMGLLLDGLEAHTSEQLGEVILHAGWLGGRQVALAGVPVGPVNAALGAQALIIRHGVRSLIGLGSAGALDPNLGLGALVIARQAVPHDAGVFHAQRFLPSGAMGRDEGGRLGYRRALQADVELVDWALSASRSLDPPVYAGTVVSGNQVICSTARKRWLRETFGALAVEMETAAVAQVAVAHRVPWVAVRAISDMASDRVYLDYERLAMYLDDGRPAWRRQASRWFYLASQPAAWRYLLRLQKGLALASRRSAQLVETMLKT
jgi:adenosylhomocysteine nucleosidase